LNVLNDLNIDMVREVLKVTKEVPIERAYDFSFTKKADSELTQAGWKPQQLPQVGLASLGAERESHDSPDGATQRNIVRSVRGPDQDL